MLKNKLKYIFIIILLTTAIFNTKIINATNEKIELSVYDTNERTDYVSMNDFLNSIMDDEEGSYYYFFTLTGASLVENNINLEAIDINVVLKGLNIEYDLIKDPFNEEPSEEIGTGFNKEKIPYFNGIINNKLSEKGFESYLSFNLTSIEKLPYQTIYQEDTVIYYLGLRFDYDQMQNISNISGFEIELLYSTSSDHNDIKLTNSGTLNENEVVLNSLVIGDPNAGPSTELSSLKISGNDDTYYNESSNITPTGIELNNITYQDSINGLNIEYKLKSPTAEVTSIDLHDGETHIKKLDVDNPNTGEIKKDYEIRITVKDEEEVKVYIIKINSIIDADSDTKLKDPMETNLDSDTTGKIISKELREKSYIVTVDFTTTNITLFPKPNNPLGTVDEKEVVFSNLNVGENSKKVVVRSESGDKKEYDLIVKREEPSSDTDFNVKVNNEDAVREDNNFSYELNLNNGNYSITFNELVETAKYYYKEGNSTNEDVSDYESLKTINGSINTGKSITYTVLAVAQDDSKYLYYITITREESNDTSIDGIEIKEDYNPYDATKEQDNKYIYELKDNDSTYIEINVLLKEGQSKQVLLDDEEINGQIEVKDLKYGENKFKIIVTAQNNVDEKEIELIIVKLSTEKELLELNLYNDESKDIIRELSDFDVKDKGSYDEYKVELDYNEAKRIKLTLKSSSNSKILKSNSNISNPSSSFDITHEFSNVSKTSFETDEFYIEAEKAGVTSKPFKIVVVRKGAETGNELETILVNDETIDGFKSTHNGPYNVLVDRDINSVHIDYLLKDNSKLANVLIEGRNISGQTLDISPGSEQKVTITVISESGDERSYTINVIAKSDENEIENIEITNTDESQFNFDKNIFEYDFEVPYGISEIELLVRSSEHSKVFGDGLKTLKSGESHTFEIYVESEYGTKSDTYTIKVKRKKPRDFKDLDSLTFNIDGNTEIDVLNDLNQTSPTDFTYNYNRNVENIKITAKITGKNGEYFASNQGTNGNVLEINKTLTKGESNVFTIKVRDEFGDEKEYTLTVNVFDDNTDLDTITINNKTYSVDDFINNKLVVEDVLFNTNYVNFLYELRSDYSNFIIDSFSNVEPSISSKRWYLDEGVNTFKFYIEAEDESRSDTYEVEIQRLAANTNNDLESLLVEWENGSYEWDKTTNDIYIRVDRDVEDINIHASILSEHRSTITGLNKDSEDTNKITYINTITSNSNKLEFKVISENGNENKFTIHITRKNTITDIESITVYLKDSEEVIYEGDFLNDETFNIEDLIPYHEEELIIVIKKIDKYTKVTINGNKKENEIEVSETIKINKDGSIKIIVETDFDETDKPEGSYKKEEMTLTYQKNDPREYRSLDELNVYYKDEEGNVIDALENIFDSDKTNYEIRLDRDIINVELDGTTSNGAKIISGLGDKTLLSGKENVYSVIVEAENGRTREYKLTIISKNDNNEISNILVEGNEIGFNKETKEYTYNKVFSYDTKEVNIDVTLEDEFATYEVSKNKNLSPGIHTIEVYSISEFGTKSIVYKIEIEIETPYTNVDLESLDIYDENNNKLNFVDDYKEGKYNYQLELDDNYNFNNVKIVAKLLNEDKQSIETSFNLDSILIEEDENGKVNQTIIFIVHAEGVSQEYRITITKDVVLNNDALVKEVTLKDSDNKNYIEFKESKESYEITVPYSIDKLNLLVKPNDTNLSNIEKTITLNVGNNYETFKVIAEDGTEGIEYELIITREEPSKNNLLDEILIESNGEYILGLSNKNPLIEFDPKTNNYLITLNETYKEIIISRVLGDKNQTTHENGFIRNAPTSLNHGENIFEIIVSPEDENAIGEKYTITIQIVNSNIELEDLWVEGFELDYEKDKYSYDLGEVDGTVTSINIYGIISDEYGTIKGLGIKTLKEGLNVFEIVVKSEDESVELTYEITITQTLSDNVKLDDLTLKDSSGNNLLTYDEEEKVYNIIVNSNIKEVYLDAVANHPNTTLTGTGKYNLNLDEEKTIILTVTSEDGTKDEYIIKVIRESLSTINLLKEISIESNGKYILGLSDKNPIHEFKEDVFNYEIKLNESYKDIIIRRVLLEDNQETLENFTRNVSINLVHGINGSYEIIVTPEDKDADKAKYTITIQIVNSNIELEDLWVEGFELDYEKDKYSYDLGEVDGTVTSINIDGIISDEYGTITGLGNKPLTEGLNVFEVVVKSEDESVELIYEISITQTLSSDYSIKDAILIDNEGYDYLNFKEDIYEYDISVPYEIDNLELLINANHPNAVVYGNTNVNLEPNKVYKLSFYIEAEDGSISKEYNILVIREEPEDKNELHDLYVVDNVTNEKIYLDVEESFHEVIVDSNATRVEIGGKEPSGSIVDGFGNHRLKTNEDIFIVNVTTSKNYRFSYVIRIKKVSSDSSLKDLIVSDANTNEELELSPTFESNILKYNIDLTNRPEINEIYIDAIPNSKIRYIDGIGFETLKTGDGITTDRFLVNVTAEDGLSRTTYEIIITRNVKPEDNVTIDELNLIGEGINYLSTNKDLSIKEFLNSKYEYTINVEYSLKNIYLDILNESGAKIYGSGSYELKDKETIIEFYLISKSGNVTSETYTIKVIKEDPSENNLLKDILIDGESVLDFDPLINNYEIDFIYNENTIIEIEALLDDLKANITGNIGKYEIDHGVNNIKITVISESGLENVYNIKITAKYDDNEIINIIEKDYDFDQSFNEEIDIYNLNLPYDVNSINFIVEASPYAKVYGDGIHYLDEGLNEFIIYAISEFGTTGKEYQINVYRDEISTDNTLKDLEITNADTNEIIEYSPKFDAMIDTYIINLDKDSSVENIYINATANNKYATVGGVGFKVLKAKVDDLHQNVFEIVVRAQDGSTKTYTIFIYRDVNLSDSVQISSFELKGSDEVTYLGTTKDSLLEFKLSNDFYEITVPYNVKSITSYMKSDHGIVYGNETKSFNNKDSLEFNLKVVSQSGKEESKTYTIIVKRELGNINNDLKELLIDGELIEDFDPNITNYEINIPFGSKNDILIEASTYDEKSTIYGDLGKQVLNSGKNVFTISVKAENGDVKTYTINVNYLDGNALLEDLLIKDTDSNEYIDFDFDPEKFTYNIEIKKSVYEVLVSGIAKDLGNASIKGEGRYEISDGTKTQIFIYVIAADGLTEVKYTINLRHDYKLSNNAKLKSLIISGVEFDFDPNENYYYIDLDKSLGEINIIAETFDENATYEILSSNKISDGNNSIIIRVIAEDGTTEYYNVNIYQVPQENNLTLILLILSILLWIITVLVMLIRNNKHNKNNNEDLFN